MHRIDWAIIFIFLAVMAGLTLYTRLALIAELGVITKVFYPVFPPDRNAADVLAWLREHRAA